MNKKIIKKIDQAVDVLGRAMIFTMLLILATEFIILGIFGFKIFCASAQTPPAKKAVNPANVPQIAVPVGDFYRECAVCAAKKTTEEQNACYATFDSTKCFDVQRPENWIGQYVQAWFNYLVGAIGIIAVVMVMWGGIKWIASGGNSSQIEEAKGKIKNAVVGIVLLLGAYTIFKTVNPQLLNLSLPPIEQFAETEEICCKNDKGSAAVNDDTYRITYNKCEEGEEQLPDMTECNKSMAERAEQEKKSMCPVGTEVITFDQNPGSYDRSYWTNLVKSACGVTSNDPVENEAKIDFTKTSTELQKLGGVYFGCYACKKSPNNNIGFPKCNWADACKGSTPIERPVGQGLCADPIPLGQKCCCEATISTTNDEAQIRAKIESKGISFNYENACSPNQTSGCTSVAGMKDETVAEILFLAEKVGPENVKITGGTEDGHTLPHKEGFKFDTSKTAKVTKYVKDNAKRISSWSDGTIVYVMANGAEYAEESDHWDVCVNCERS